MSVLRTETRRTIAPWITVLMLAVGLGFFFLFSGPWWKNAAAWNAQWTSSVLWVRYLLSLLWPIIVGAAAIQGMRDRRSGMVELLSTTPRPVSHRTAKLGLALGSSAVVGYLVIVVVGLGQVIAHDGMFTFTWVLPLLVGIASVVAGVAVGLAVGRLLPHPLTAPAAAVVALVVGVLLQASSDAGSPTQRLVPNSIALLSPTASQPRSPFTVPVMAVNIGQLCWLLGLSATGLLLLAAGTARKRLLALLPVVAGLAVAVPIFPASAADNVAENQTATALVCDGPVCVTKMHVTWLSTLAGPGTEALTLLEKLPDHPQRIVESTERAGVTHGGRRDGSTLLLRYDDSLLSGVQGRDLVNALVAGGGTASCGDPSTRGAEQQDAARFVAGSWLVGELRQPSHANYYSPQLPALMQDAWTKLRALPDSEQRARVAAVRHAELSCQEDAYAALTEGAAG
ncbi:hypothetical protein QRX50_14150 [Amycolatopsis carbonis]|uniref:Uncharacterized protein n=1 Tax=Amycolatopsis carbonis TaxID=715471 RepID=A0A9Y2IM54_9PSEU|nr:hypothetical protein [Amycolatopsis sp. 2-15]WIX81811.1 hypothetical protein QRX50_14150 [Amycolatopsis sp. 2-15]